MVARGGYRRRRTSWSAAPTAARARAIEWARTTAVSGNVVYLDTETTGLGAGDEIVDIAIVGADGAVLIDTLVRPTNSIPLVASGIHGIRDRDVVDAPTWSEIYPRLFNIFDSRIVVVYNATFDAQMVRQCCSKSQIAEPMLDWQCAMRAYADFEGLPGRSGGFRLHSLESAARRFGITPGGHRARADAEVCRAVVQAMAAADEF